MSGNANSSVRSIPACAGEPPQYQQPPQDSRVYPRVCGGTGTGDTPVGGKAGLSPRVRGNLVGFGHIGQASGSIPACAGEPPPDSTIPAPGPVYPRVCGGTLPASRNAQSLPGLSPRVRGNHEVCIAVANLVGSIPACAGEPNKRMARHYARRVYPRVCGGTASLCDVTLRNGGLSPRVRGNREKMNYAFVLARSIPACAGEPRCSGARPTAWRVYPRVCGGTVSSSSRLWPNRGLSPRVRGNPGLPARTRPDAGSIPACAGEPSSPAASAAALTVYPRVCGGTPTTMSPTSGHSGLSPRVRGNRYANSPGNGLHRSIPACAGEPRGWDAWRAVPPVYPRVCGGTLAMGGMAVLLLGLSPRVRGNRRYQPNRRRNAGSIPACAGEPAAPPANAATRTVYPRVCGGTWRG